MIDYNLLASSCDYYEIHNFKRIELPWTVTPEIDDITRPTDSLPFELKHNGKRLIASGEQGFLYQYCKNYLPLGKFQSVTPCYRFESYNFTHQKNFIKNELIITDEVNNDKLDWIIKTAFNFFKLHLPDLFHDNLKVIKINDSYDIVLVINKIEYELGSYGIRKCEFLKWIYGTGLAEPRFSNLLKLII
jgi:hypothetical protein